MTHVKALCFELGSVAELFITHGKTSTAYTDQVGITKGSGRVERPAWPVPYLTLPTSLAPRLHMQTKM